MMTKKMVFSRFNGVLLCMAYLLTMSCCLIGAQHKKGDISRVKELYNNHYDNFKEYVLDLREEVNGYFAWIIENGARYKRGYNEFTVACIPISYPFFKCSTAYVEHILTSIKDEKYLHCIEHSIERCKQKPDNLKLFDWVAQVSHEEHINNIALPADVKKEELIANPGEYQKIIKQVSSEERDKLIAVGLFSQYLAKNNLL